MCKCGFCIKPDFAGRLKKSPKCGTNLEIQKERIWTDMNKLKCSVTTCRHNANDLCELRIIQVDGPAALESRETCCGSYAEPSTARITITASAARTASVWVAVAQTRRSSARRNAARLSAERNRF